MDVFLNRIDAAPLYAEEFSFDFESWVSNFVDGLNFTLSEIQDEINSKNQLPQLTQAAIVALGPTAVDGEMWYCTNSVPPNVVIKIDGALRQVTHTAFP